nr:MAG TPA: hypothetical protein [Caudoviricetes sp.]
MNNRLTISFDVNICVWYLLYYNSHNTIKPNNSCITP